MSGIIKMVHSVEDDDGPYQTIAEVAEYFERSKDTIRRWCKTLTEISGDAIPNHKMPLSDTDENSFVWLYTENDIARLEDFSSDINPKGGRPKSE